MDPLGREHVEHAVFRRTGAEGVEQRARMVRDVGTWLISAERKRRVTIKVIAPSE